MHAIGGHDNGSDDSAIEQHGRQAKSTKISKRNSGLSKIYCLQQEVIIKKKRSKRLKHSMFKQCLPFQKNTKLNFGIDNTDSMKFLKELEQSVMQTYGHPNNGPIINVESTTINEEVPNQREISHSLTVMSRINEISIDSHLLDFFNFQIEPLECRPPAQNLLVTGHDNSNMDSIGDVDDTRAIEYVNRYALEWKKSGGDANPPTRKRKRETADAQILPQTKRPRIENDGCQGDRQETPNNKAVCLSAHPYFWPTIVNASMNFINALCIFLILQFI